MNVVVELIEDGNAANLEHVVEARKLAVNTLRPLRFGFEHDWHVQARVVKAWLLTLTSLFHGYALDSQVELCDNAG